MLVQHYIVGFCSISLPISFHVCLGYSTVFTMMSIDLIQDVGLKSGVFTVMSIDITKGCLLEMGVSFCVIYYRGTGCLQIRQFHSVLFYIHLTVG